MSALAQRLYDGQIYFQISDFEEVSQAVEKATCRQLQTVESTDYPEVVFLGTGSAIPSKYRNVSSILLNITATSSLLLDCGENSYSQLFQLYGPVMTDEILCRIGGVFISHLHADHHLGLFTLLSQRQRAFERLGRQFEKAVVIAAAPLFKMQRLYSETVEDVTSLLTPIPSVHQNLPELLQRLSIRLRVKQLELVKVIHPMMAFGIVVYTNCGRKIVFSGDTRPCPALVQVQINFPLMQSSLTLINSAYLARLATTVIFSSTKPRWKISWGWTPSPRITRPLAKPLALEERWGRRTPF